MLELTNLKSGNVELTEQEKQQVYGGAIAGLTSAAVTVGDIGVRAFFGQPLDSAYFAGQASRAAIGAGLGFAFGGPKGAALDS